jgi:hypothetical protein
MKPPNSGKGCAEMKPITPAEAVKIIDEVFPPKESDPRENIPPAATLDDFGQADQGNADDDEVAGNDSGSGSGPRSGAQEEKRQERFTLTRFNAVRLASSPAYLVKGLIPRGGLTVVWGPPKCGKSFWTFDLTMQSLSASTTAAAACSRAPWFISRSKAAKASAPASRRTAASTAPRTLRSIS